MSGFELLALLLTLTALLAFANERWLHLSGTIGATVGGLVTSLLLTLAAHLGLADNVALRALRGIDFDRILMQGLLSFLLFAGAFEIDVGSLLRHRWRIISLATVGVLISTFLVGTALWGVADLFGLSFSYGYALLFGALISPTDPVAVLAILRDAGAPEDVVSTISGESLFNDGVGVVVFTMILGVVLAHRGPSVEEIGRLFLEEAVGGVVFGLVLGLFTDELLRQIDNYTVEILITLAAVTGGYALAGRLHTSGPLAMVVAGLLVGSRGRRIAMSRVTEEHLEGFWEVVDGILNMMLFMLVGVELLVLKLSPSHFVAGLIAIPLVLAARFVSVALPMAMIKLRASIRPWTVTMMTWGGLRGGIAIALALSIPRGEGHDLLVTMTYIVVIFSILVQGLTVGRLSRRIYGAPAPGRPAPTDLPEIRGV